MKKLGGFLLLLTLTGCFGDSEVSQQRKDKAECQQYVGRVFDSLDECLNLLEEHRQREKELLKDIQQQKE